MAIRVLEIVFFLYFATHIPITLFIDLQALLPGHVYPQPVSALLQNKLTYSSCFYLTEHFSHCPPAERPPEVVCRTLQRPHGSGSTGVVQVFHFLRGSASVAIFPNCSVCFSERSVNTTQVGRLYYLRLYSVV